MASRYTCSLLCLLAPALLAQPVSLEGRTVCGYQGWFGTPGDSSHAGWFHWSRHPDRFGPGDATFDLWPDVTGYPSNTLCATGFTRHDGSAVHVFSSAHGGVVDLHLKWMREHGIDGLFLQRFGTQLIRPQRRRHSDTVLGHVRRAAQENDRVWALMYDLSGLPPDSFGAVLADWRALKGMTSDRGYLHAKGRPLVGLWGIGFKEPNRPRAAPCRALVESFRAEGVSLLLGVPFGWRTGTRDGDPDPAFQEVYAAADVLSPWSVGRYSDAAGVAAYSEILKGDQAWVQARGITLLPVVFPGFSWHNLKGGTLDQIPRRDGAFLREQFSMLAGRGFTSAYVAMFDEFDEGTALLPYESDPPEGGGNRFVPRGPVPPDHYLRIAGEGAQALRAIQPAGHFP